MKKQALLAFLLLCVSLLSVGCNNKNTPNHDADQSTTTTATTTSAPKADPNLKVENCYTFTENANLTFSYSVKGRSGNVLLSEQDIDRPVSFEVANKDVLIVYGQAGTGVGARWARFCNIQTDRISGFGGYLAAVDTRVAFVDQRTGGIHVFVCDAFDPNTYYGVYTLEDIPENTDPIEDFALSEEGVLSVTYRTNSGNKTIQIDMTATQDE
ncbi:MAG: hypothetical protein IKL13_06495 [Clostridia bacterium]|nr:hypothetical protein [Clostridia bacterium]